MGWSTDPPGAWAAWTFHPCPAKCHQRAGESPHEMAVFMRNHLWMGPVPLSCLITGRSTKKMVEQCQVYRCRTKNPSDNTLIQKYYFCVARPWKYSSFGYQGTLTQHDWSCSKNLLTDHTMPITFRCLKQTWTKKHAFQKRQWHWHYPGYYQELAIWDTVTGILHSSSPVIYNSPPWSSLTVIATWLHGASVKSADFISVALCQIYGTIIKSIVTWFSCHTRPYQNM